MVYFLTDSSSHLFISEANTCKRLRLSSKVMLSSSSSSSPSATFKFSHSPFVACGSLLACCGSRSLISIIILGATSTGVSDSILEFLFINVYILSRLHSPKVNYNHALTQRRGKMYLFRVLLLSLNRLLFSLLKIHFSMDK